MMTSADVSDSVGYRLTEAAQSFGGDVLTLTDVAIALGVAPRFAPGEIHAGRETCQRAFAQMMRQVEDGIDQEIVPLAYLPGDAARVRIKVSGPLRTLSAA